MSETRATEVIFRARGLTKVYRMGDVEVRALRGIDLALYQGEFVVMLGPSGSGKSTLLNILGGLDTPTAGEVWYHGEDLSHADDARLTRFRREHVGFVFQFYNLIPSLTARECGDCHGNRAPSAAASGCASAGRAGGAARPFSGAAFGR